jgi:hypothetical protein
MEHACCTVSVFNVTSGRYQQALGVLLYRVYLPTLLILRASAIRDIDTNTPCWTYIDAFVSLRFDR